MQGCVCCLGAINIDVTLRVDRLPERHEKLMAREIKLGGGGSASNTAVWLSRQGVKVRMFGWVGDDIFGVFGLQDLQANGVDTNGVKSLRAASPVAICVATPDDKRIIASPIIDAPWTPDDIGELGEEVDWLHTTVCDAAFLKRAKDSRGKPGAVLSVELDGGYDPLLPTIADYLFSNADELARALGTEDFAGFIAERHRADPAIWFVTLGDKGALTINAGRIAFVAGAAVAPVDRTGGGDAFNAGVIAALLSGADPESAAAAGLDLAAQAIGRLGAR
jgi:sugar/nucleoside kinase (ribokinase family)